MPETFFISFSPGFNRLINLPSEWEPFQRFLIRWVEERQYRLRKRVGSCFAEVSLYGLTHPLTQVVLTNQPTADRPVETGCENEMENLSAFQ